MNEKKVKLIELMQMNHRNKIISVLLKSENEQEEGIDVLLASSNQSSMSSVESVIRNININDQEIDQID